MFLENIHNYDGVSKKARSIETLQSPTILHRNPCLDHGRFAFLNHFREDLPMSKGLTLITEVQR